LVLSAARLADRSFPVRHAYFEAILLIERLHRHFLEVVKVELDQKDVQDINNVQALILYNISTDEMTVGELTARGYYLGSNVSYNVKKMVENNYLVQERSPHDRRSVRVKLSDKGLALQKHLQAAFEKQVGMLANAQIGQDELVKVSDSMRKLERFWTSMLNYSGIAN
jgi:DNA-binding MarR family transcriptional regulator